MARLKTPEDVRAELSANGESVRELAKSIGRANQYHLVYAVLTGRNKGVRGESHAIAVELGIKRGTIRSTA